MRCVATSVLGLLLTGVALAGAPSTGHYRLRVPEDAVRVARLAGKPLPFGKLDLRSGGEFTLDTESSHRVGTYRLFMNRLYFKAKDGAELKGEVFGKRVVVEGLEFDREEGRLTIVDRTRDEDTARDDATSRGETPKIAAPTITSPVTAELAMPATSPATVAPELPATAPAPKKRELPSMKGLWTVHRNGIEEKGLKMDLREDGKFKFSMAGATSEGTWSVKDGAIELVWTKVDGEDVEPGTMHKTLWVSDEGTSFKIDTYVYERASSDK